MYIAHTREREALARPGQSLKVHSTKVSQLASSLGCKCGLKEISRFAGYRHDYGKNSRDFQEYIEKIALGADVERGSVRHSVFGAKKAYSEVSSSPIAAEILSNVILAHHGELYDYLAPDGSTPLTDKLSGVTSFSYEDNDDVVDISKFNHEIEYVLGRIPQNEKMFGTAMLTKLVFSCLVDADRLDAYLHKNGKDYCLETTDWKNMLFRLENNIENLPKTAKAEVRLLRQSISDACAMSGSREIGIYKLEVPTGGGKTLSALRFALEHAKKHKLERIIYVAPYLTILSQTAEDIRKALGSDEKYILEHHSNFQADDEVNHKFHANRWDAPIILTTLVQFLESIFSAKNSDLRKLSNMSRSVLIFDEAQSLPVKCVYLFNSAVNFLHRVCGSTILLCTATQPLLDAAELEHPLTFSEYPSIAECGRMPERTRIESAIKPGGYSYPELAEFVMGKHSRSTLVIVNTKSAAKYLYDELTKTRADILHLSTNMCTAHRDHVIAELRRRLDPEVDESVICVSTQLIEAGVNISFECVIRDIAGLDNIYQAAGRCNRHREYEEIKPVYVVNIANENLSKLPDIKTGAEITRRLFDEGHIDINTYYQHYFYARRKQMDYPIPEGGTVYDLLSANMQGRAAYKDRTDRQNIKPPVLLAAIRSAANAFCVIEKGLTEVIVPYGDAATLLNQFLFVSDSDKARVLLRSLTRYSVALYKYQLDELRRNGALNEECYSGITVLDKGFYDNARGVDLEGSPEFLIV
ncbi:MAG: CRISPR-associated helicase Cas3' [Oscillospiraceae bacterium]|nr:CRISPR-associated helicase Cas3' [Oscillospiraceae bacterium]